MATAYPDDFRRPLSAYAAVPNGSAVMGRRPPINMGMAQEVPRTALPPGGSAQSPLSARAAMPPMVTAPPVPASDVIGRRPTINMGAADVVQPPRVPTSASAAGALPAAETAAVSRPLSSAARAVPAAGAALAVGLEGKQVYDVARDPNSTGLDVAAQVAQGAGRLGAAGAGAAAGAAAGSVIPVVGTTVGGLVGGGLGYLAADRAIAAGRAALGGDPRAPADQLSAAAPTSEAAPAQGGGAVFGVYPRPSSRISTNANDAALQRGVQATGPSTFVPAAPLSEAALPPAPSRLNATTDPRSMTFAGVPADTAPPAAAPPSAAASLAPPAVAAPVPLSQAAGLPAGVTRDGNSYSGTNVRAPEGALPADPTRANPLGSAADTQAQLANLQRSNASVPQGGLTVIDNGGPNRNADFNDSAQLRTVLARGAAPGRGGAAAFAQQVQGAAMPLAQRAQAAQTDTEQAGAIQRAQLAERGLAARAQMTDARQAEGNSIDRARLGIDAIRAGQSGVPTGYRMRADGMGLEPTPGGPADPNTPKGKNTLNDTQAKALQFGTRMLTAGQGLDRLAAAGTNQPGLIKRAADVVGLGGAANFTQSAEQQQVEQFQRDFVNATLRRESGAAISDGEFANARQQYFPQPGDSPQVIEQKRRNRDLATQGFLAEVPDQQNRVRQVLDAAGQVSGAPSSSLPAGMSRQVGTSGGKPVYEDGQGRRFIGG